MAEHVHLVLHPEMLTKLGSVIRELKSISASRIIADQLIDLSGPGGPPSGWVSSFSHSKLWGTGALKWKQTRSVRSPYSKTGY